MASVAGDFYDFAFLDSQWIGILIADVAGHGLPAALMASMVKVAFAWQREHAHDSPLVFSGLNEIFCNQLRGQYVTATYLLINCPNASLSTQQRDILHCWCGAHRTRRLSLMKATASSLDSYRLKPNQSPRSHCCPATGCCSTPMDCSRPTTMLARALEIEAHTHIAARKNLSADSFPDALLADLDAWTAASDGHRQDDHLTAGRRLRSGHVNCDIVRFE